MKEAIDAFLGIFEKSVLSIERVFIEIPQFESDSFGFSVWKRYTWASAIEHSCGRVTLVSQYVLLKEGEQ